MRRQPRKRGRKAKRTREARHRNLTRLILQRIAILHQFFRAQFLDPNPARAYLSYQALADRFGWSKSTVIRDINFMRDVFRLPLEDIKERGGWGYTEDVSFVPSLLMSEGDLVILAAAWGALQGPRNTANGNPFAARVRPVMEDLMTVLGHDLSFDFQTVADRIVFRSSGYHAGIDITTFETVVKAVLTGHRLRFTYRKISDDGRTSAPETRSVEPRTLVCMDHAWYLIANDPRRGGQARSFALYRMTNAVDTGEKFTPIEPFTLDDILRDTLGIHTGGPVETVELRFAPAAATYARQYTWHSSEEFIEQPDGYLHLTLRVSINPELESRIHRFGPKVEVLHPPSLREKFTQYAREFAGLYQIHC